MEEELPLVTIRCITYNHEPYIRQCLEGFVMQKTNFKFEAIVHDDASTDKTADIIKEYAKKYPDIIKPIYETENQYSKRDGSLTRIMDEHTRGKYVALCEGDDYWIDPLKLQMQVEFMEDNNEYGLVHTDASCMDSHNNIKSNLNNNELYKKINNYKGEALLEQILLRKLLIRTASVLIRGSIYKQVIVDNRKIFTKKFMMGDIQLWCGVAIKSKIHYINQVMICYRLSKNSVTRGTYKNICLFNLSSAALRMEYLKLYKFPLSTEKVFINNYIKSYVMAKSYSKELSLEYCFRNDNLSIVNKILLSNKFVTILYVYSLKIKFKLNTYLRGL